MTKCALRPYFNNVPKVPVIDELEITKNDINIIKKLLNIDNK
jgi:hypothetical protein